MVARRKRKGRKKVRRKGKKVSRVTRVKRARRTRRVIRKRVRDDLQWRVSNSLLILVIGLMFLGYGAAQMGITGITAYQVLPGEGCEPPQPLPSAWSECIDGAEQRVIYTCDEATGNWVGNVETRECEEPPFKELPVAYMLVGVVLVALAVISLLLYKKKFERAEPGAVPAGPPQW